MLVCFFYSSKDERNFGICGMKIVPCGYFVSSLILFWSIWILRGKTLLKTLQRYNNFYFYIRYCPQLPLVLGKLRPKILGTYTMITSEMHTDFYVLPRPQVPDLTVPSNPKIWPEEIWTLFLRIKINDGKSLFFVSGAKCILKRRRSLFLSKPMPILALMPVCLSWHSQVIMNRLAESAEVFSLQ